ncbi:uncharacterized protein MONOS_15156 [Monocercomonoides exilis]|uniref:uncharacterized protein n=1 Tax=Monocercomonoides exilis TaxID=2049356 RepID=UPI0035598955|nr:hypothetical protein MONOS_15156 [Monocercomonoides exilis]|eukprot:MONOS_15156.1-p1 / transcript=MONOS_15156.1 / gene=MONOS_15156 / organism=Monocercomonoides_exilis_PA203 / gene_product=unspecified product / transcript_product=unspecified product / location=Mono_scaffold01158:4220-4765(-) / protein_length=182 / sequence_SO=supercontig / SO=protein_coding / is_pseudo=false
MAVLIGKEKTEMNITSFPSASSSASSSSLPSLPSLLSHSSRSLLQATQTAISISGSTNALLCPPLSSPFLKNASLPTSCRQKQKKKKMMTKMVEHLTKRKAMMRMQSVSCLIPPTSVPPPTSSPSHPSLLLSSQKAAMNGCCHQMKHAPHSAPNRLAVNQPCKYSQNWHPHSDEHSAQSAR